MVKETGWRRATGMLLALHDINKDYPERLRFKFTSARLPTKVEWMLINRFKGNKLSDAFDSMQRGFYWYKTLKNENISKDELTKKGWLKMSDITFAKKISKYLN